MALLQLAFSGSFDSVVASAPAALKMTEGEGIAIRQGLAPSTRGEAAATSACGRRLRGNFQAVWSEAT